MMDVETREAVVDRALGACFRATVASERSLQIREVARRLRSEAAGHGWPRTFLVVGTVEDMSVRAFWSRRRLVVSNPLRRRAEVLVAMGERFEVEGPDTAPVTAGLEDPVPALLTLMRACDRVTAVQLGPMMVQARGGPPVVGWTPG
jgi:hypothetical protein